MKKILFIGSLLSFMVIVAIACNIKDKEKTDSEASYYDNYLSKSKDGAFKTNDSEQNYDIPSNDIPKNHYKEISFPTPNIDSSSKNSVEGVILHHTAEPTVQRSLEILTSLK